MSDLTYYTIEELIKELKKYPKDFDASVLFKGWDDGSVIFLERDEICEGDILLKPKLKRLFQPVKLPTKHKGRNKIL